MCLLHKISPPNNTINNTIKQAWSMSRNTWWITHNDTKNNRTFTYQFLGHTWSYMWNINLKVKLLHYHCIIQIDKNSFSKYVSLAVLIWYKSSVFQEIKGNSPCFEYQKVIEAKQKEYIKFTLNISRLKCKFNWFTFFKEPNKLLYTLYKKCVFCFVITFLLS